MIVGPVLRTNDQIATLLYPVSRTHLGDIIICGFQVEIRLFGYLDK